MNAEQKRAWVGIGSGIACVVGYIALVPFVGPLGATVALTLALVYPFAFLVFPGWKEKPDERDRTISRSATSIGFMASYMAFVSGCMGVWFVAHEWQGRKMVSVHVLAVVTAFGFAVFCLVRSLAVLRLYGRHVESDRA
jgi:hypothetical protein